ncbi:MAG: DUF5689 domain-containing protein [Bacteroidota bacterium]|nr:DUF5689 domain-containing protein [Bacteroidota bacterium]
MNTFKRLLAGFFTLSLLLTACDQREFDMPPFNEPVYSGKANLSIAGFKAKYASSSVAQITDDDIISGLIVANDVSGNFYKEFTIMDSTGGLKIAINEGDLYTDFRLGQRVFIECKDLYVGKYGGYMQLGGPYNSGIGQMTWETATAHIFKDGWPDPKNALLEPEVISMNVVTAEANLGKLVTLENVYFANGGQEVCAAAGSDGSTQTLSKTLVSTDYAGKTIVVRLSSAADFANKTLPAGNGNLTGILSVYNNTYQFTPRDSMDFAFAGFGAGYENLGSGTKANPYLVKYALNHQASAKAAWVKGYIVGSVKSGINSTNPVNGNEDISWSAPFMNNTVVIAADSTEKNWKNCLVVNLPAESALRSSANLSDSPANLHHVLAVTGTFENYLGAGGVTVATGSKSEFWLDEISGESLPYTEAFNNTLGLFTTYDALGAQSWAKSSYSGDYFAKMTGWANSLNNANEDWLISPAISLKGITSATIKFDHAVYFKTTSTPSTENTLWISKNYTSGDPSKASWTKLTIPNYQTANFSYNFVSSGDISIPSGFMGSNVKIAFKYLSTTSTTSTWELKNLAVTGN